MLAAAKALFDHGVKDEDAIVGTIAFAWYVEQPTTQLAEKYRGIEVLGTAGNVPVLRLMKVSAAVVEREETHFPSAIKVSVYSKHAKPPEVAARYKDVLLDRFIEYGRSRGGDIGWSFQDAHLAITVSPEEEVPAGYLAGTRKATRTGEYPRDRFYAFPSSGLVRRAYEMLLGSADPRAPWRFASFLNDTGRPWRMKAETAILACAVALLEKEFGGRPKARRLLAARALNDHLLAPLGMGELPQNLEERLAAKRGEKDRYVKLYAQGLVDDEELEIHLADLKNQVENLKVLAAAVEADLAAKDEQALVARISEAWLLTLRESLAEVEQDTDGALGARRELAKLLVEGIFVSRGEDGRPRVEITYRFGPPEPGPGRAAGEESALGKQDSEEFAKAHAGVGRRGC